MPITSLTSYFNTSSFGDTNTYTRNQQELALTLDSAAHELANWKSLIAMSAGGGAFEGGRLLATTFFSSVPVLSAIPLLTKAVTFFAGALADTSLTRLIHQAFGNVGEEESFSEQITSQGSVRLLGVLGAGQCFVVIQLLQGLASVSRGMVCGESSQNQQSSFLHHLLMGLQCHFGSGMFAGLTGGVLAAVEQRMSLRAKNIFGIGRNLSQPNRLEKIIPDNLKKFIPHPLIIAGVAGIHFRMADTLEPGDGGAHLTPSNAIHQNSAEALPSFVPINLINLRDDPLSFEDFKTQVFASREVSKDFRLRQQYVCRQLLGFNPTKSQRGKFIQGWFVRFARQAVGQIHLQDQLITLGNVLKVDRLWLEKFFVSKEKIKTAKGVPLQQEKGFRPLPLEQSDKHVHFENFQEHMKAAGLMYPRDIDKIISFVYFKIMDRKSGRLSMKCSVRGWLRRFAVQAEGFPHLEMQVRVLKEMIGMS